MPGFASPPTNAMAIAEGFRIHERKKALVNGTRGSDAGGYGELFPFTLELFFEVVILVKRVLFSVETILFFFPHSFIPFMNIYCQCPFQESYYFSKVATTCIIFFFFHKIDRKRLVYSALNISACPLHSTWVTSKFQHVLSSFTVLEPKN